MRAKEKGETNAARWQSGSGTATELLSPGPFTDCGRSCGEHGAMTLSVLLLRGVQVPVTSAKFSPSF